MNNLVIHLCCLWWGKERIHKQLILNITSTDMHFYLGIFCTGKQVRCHHLCQLLRFWLHHVVCSLSLFQEQRQTSMKEVEEGVTERKSERERETEYVHRAFVSPAHVFVCVSILVLNFWTRLCISHSSAILVGTRHIWAQRLSGILIYHHTLLKTFREKHQKTLKLSMMIISPPLLCATF